MPMVRIVPLMSKDKTTKAQGVAEAIASGLLADVQSPPSAATLARRDTLAEALNAVMVEMDTSWNEPRYVLQARIVDRFRKLGVGEAAIKRALRDNGLATND